MNERKKKLNTKLYETDIKQRQITTTTENVLIQLAMRFSHDIDEQWYLVLFYERQTKMIIPE